MANTLFLRLEGPLQSWGERARWSVRDSAPEPTKSGVVGLLACALGLSEDDDLRALSQQIRFGVRCDKAGTSLIDYHTVIGGVMSAEGKVKINANTREPETVVSQRYYLCDASFLAVIQSDDEALIGRLAEKVQDPHWPFFLGRKCCSPSRPPFAGLGTFDSLNAALAIHPLNQKGEGQARVRAMIECKPAEGGATRRRDEVDSRRARTFLPRYTKEVWLDVSIQWEEV